MSPAVNMSRTVGRAAAVLLAGAAAGLVLASALSSTGDAARTGEEPSMTATERTQLARATFAGGCFWCMEPPYDELEGVASTTSGYAGGEEPNPTYEEVASGATGHAEVVQVAYDPERIDYRELLDVFWRNVDPTDAGGQFCDRGSQYRTAIFYHDEEQRRLAEASKEALEGSERPGGSIVTEIEPLEGFWEAEENHQDYYRKKPLRYKFYRFSCGRDGRLDEIWGDDRDEPLAELRQLTG